MAEQLQSSLFDGLDFDGFDTDKEVITMEVDKTKTEEPVVKTEEKKLEEKVKEESADDKEFFTIQSPIQETETETPENTEESEEDKLEDKKDAGDPSNDKSSSSSLFKVLAKSLYEGGILSSFSEEVEASINDAESFMEVLGQEVYSQIEGYKQSLPEEIKTLIDNYEEGVPLNELINIRSEATKYKNISETDLLKSEAQMRSVIVADAKARGFTEEAANELADDAFALEKHEGKAKAALTALIKRQEDAEAAQVKSATELRRQQEETRQKNLQVVQKTFEEMKDFAGIKMDTKLKKQAQEAMLKPVGEYNGQPVNAIVADRLKDPTKFDTNMAVAWTLTKGFTDWSLFTASSKKTALDELVKQAEKAVSKVQPSKSAPERKTLSEESDEHFIKYINF